MEWVSPGRTITESDIVSFAGLTGDFTPIHVDHEYAATTPYGKPIAHGLLGLSYLAGLSSNFPAVRTVAFLRIEDWSFDRPIYIGDTVNVRSEIESCTPRGRKTGEVVWRRYLLNQRGECVQHGRLVTLVASRKFLPRKSRVKAPQAGNNGKDLQAKINVSSTARAD